MIPDTDFIIFFDESGKQKSDKVQLVLEKMVYSKLPERIVYGLLRGYGHTHPVTVLVNIESANEYKTLGLAKSMKEQLNIHSLYRGKSFIVKECQYRKKGEEIGVELTDILLGIVRTILENNHSESRKKREQINLILLLLRENLLQPFYEKIKLFELKEMNELQEIDLQSCLSLFISKNYEMYVN